MLAPPLSGNAIVHRVAGVLSHPGKEGDAGDPDGPAKVANGEILPMGKTVGGSLADVKVSLDIGDGEILLIRKMVAFHCLLPPRCHSKTRHHAGISQHSVLHDIGETQKRVGK